MAKYDYGGGCPCGLYEECIPGCVNGPTSVNFVGMCACGQNADCNCVSKEKKMANNDFGFSMVNESELESTKDSDKAEKLRAMIMPLLNNLKSNPDKDIIKWNGADRVKRIDDFITKMDQLLNS
jgi:hypothetical protein